MPRTVTISPSERYAIVGKTGSGKTVFATALAAALVPAQAKHWQARWLDSKGDAEEDLPRLHRWGFGRYPARQIIDITRKDGVAPNELAARAFADAFARKRVVVVADEYTQCVQSRQNPGAALQDIFTRGRGLGVGIIGCTQEPVFIPRQLISQASHVFLFDLSYTRDIKYVREFYREYERPLFRGDKHGFYHIAVDADGMATYYRHSKEFFDSMKERKVA